MKLLTAKFAHKVLVKYCLNLLGTKPDFIIGDNYLQRWWLVKDITSLPKGVTKVRAHTKPSRWRNTYLHCVNRDDDDRALHDHPWFNISIILRGSYREVTKRGSKVRGPGTIVFRSPWAAHRLEVVDGPVWSLFLTGPRMRPWGFHCPKGWVHWKKFTSYEEDGDGSQVGRGCGE